MRQILFASTLSLCLFGLPMLGGCDRELASEESVEVKDDGTVVREEERVTQDPQSGEVTKTEEKSVDKPNE